MDSVLSNSKVLIVDDEPEIIDIIALYLKEENIEVKALHDGREVVSCVKEYKPSLIVLDVSLPDVEGFNLCRQIRSFSMTPILFLSGRTDEMDKLKGFDSGADDYITKPFSPNELVMRIKAHLRRIHYHDYSNVLRFGSLEVDLLRQIVKVNGEPILLSAKEFQLLSFLVQHRGEEIDSNLIFHSIWGADSLHDTRTLMVHISNLRKKIEKNPSFPKWLKTVRGIGYMFDPVDYEYE